MKPQITFKVTDTEAVDLLKFLKSIKQKHEKLYGMAKEREQNVGHKGNPAKLMNKHTATKLKVEALISKIVEQI